MPEFAEKLIEYFANFQPYTIFPFEKSNGEVVQLKTPNAPPTIVGFACQVAGVHKTQIYDWANETDENGELINPEFHYALELAKTYQEHYVTQGGLLKVFHPGISALLLANWHEYQRQPLIANDENPDGPSIPTKAERDNLIVASRLEAERRKELICKERDKLNSAKRQPQTIDSTAETLHKTRDKTDD